MNIVVFDLETRLRPGSDCTWEDHAAMGVSVACAFDYLTGEYGVYMEDNICALWTRLANADLVVGFNIARFDIPVLHGAILKHPVACENPGDVEYHDKVATMILGKVYDLYDISKAGAGAGKFDKGYKCDEHLRAIWGAEAGKTGNGAAAPQLFKDGKMGELISYCLADVHRERRLFERCWTEGNLKSMGFKGGREEYPVVRPQEHLPINTGPLPFPMDGPLPPQATPGPAYVMPEPKDLASDAI